MDIASIFQKLLPLCIEAGREIHKIYQTDFSVDYKGDSSPVTEADRRAHAVLVSGLKEIEVGDVRSLPILSEEGGAIPFEERTRWRRYWLVDPLDGTKEFVSRNGEFTVNVALIQDGAPVLGVVYVPVPDIAYFGALDWGAFRVDGCTHQLPAVLVSKARSLPLKEKREPMQPIRVVASRSHLSPETEAFIQKLHNADRGVELVSAGSSVKLCTVAEGTADLYPRFAPTMEWDTAAGDAVCRAAGCEVVDATFDTPLLYNKENLLNPWFVAKNSSIPPILSHLPSE